MCSPLKSFVIYIILFFQTNVVHQFNKFSKPKIIKRALQPQKAARLFNYYLL